MDEKRFEELYNRAYERGYNTFSSFLNLEEQSELKKTYLPCTLFGGYEMAERVIAGFGEDLSEDKFPIKCICAKPVMQKFADELSHRDFLGALMNLGIERKLIGDIIVENNQGYIFCVDRIADYICENLERVRHTTVKTDLSDLPKLTQNDPEPIEIFAASKRLDVLICAIYNLSRNDASKLVASEKVFVNSKLITNASHTVNDNDIVSVRGWGRFVLVDEVKVTKKGRLVLEIKKY